VVVVVVAVVVAVAVLQKVLSLEKGDQGQSLERDHRQERQDKSHSVFSVPLRISVLVEDPSGAKDRHDPADRLWEQKSDGTDGREKSTGGFDHVLKGSVGTVVHSVASVFLVQNHLAATGFEEKGIGSDVPFEAVFVADRGEIQHRDRSSQQNEAEVEPVEVATAAAKKNLDAGVVHFFVATESKDSVGQTGADGQDKRDGPRQLEIIGSPRDGIGHGNGGSRFRLVLLQ